MADETFKQLDLELPRQKLVDQRPWAMVGFLLFLLVVGIAVYGFVARKSKALPLPEKPAAFTETRNPALLTITGYLF